MAFRFGVPGAAGLLLFGLASAAAAQSLADADFFISPMGEPFRRGTGEAEARDPIDLWFEGADADSNGMIVLAEMLRDADRFYALLDVNRDGEIAPDEMTRYENEVAPEIRMARSGGVVSRRDRNANRQSGQRMRAPDPGSSRPRRAGMVNAARGLLNNPQPVSSADADFNRGVSPDEFRRAAGQRFLLLDRNRDGRVPRAELDPPAEPER